MRVLTGFAALALVLAAGAPARATAEPETQGLLCGLASVGDPANPGSEVGEIDGGPISAAVVPATADEALANPVTVTLTCSLAIGWNAHHDDPVVASASATSPTVAVVPATVVHFTVPPGERATVCSRVTLTGRDGATRELYWDGETDEFSADPSVPCDVYYCTTTGEDGCGGDPIEDLFEVFDPYAIDLIVCPVLALLLPPDGDVEYVWNCPPYSSVAP